MCIRHGEIAFHSPFLAPRVTDSKTTLAVIVADREHKSETDWHCDRSPDGELLGSRSR
jgi:hypothetical protein